MINKKLLENFESDKFTTLIFRTLGMWSGNIIYLICQMTMKLMIMGKSRWEQSLVVVDIMEKEILHY